MRAAHGLTALVAEHLPRHIPPGGSEWDFYGPAMISRMVDIVESVVALMQADRAVDGAVLVRVLYEHVVKFCWIAIDPDTHCGRWLSDSEVWDRKLQNDAIQIGLIEELPMKVAGLQQLPDMAQLADRVDRHWGGRILGFTPPTTGAQALVTFRGMYLPVYRTASEPVHGRPEVLDAYMSRGSETWRMGPQAAAESMFWPLIVPLFAWALLVCHQQWGWPDPHQARATNNAMYGA
jgi:hypothetical protein